MERVPLTSAAVVAAAAGLADEAGFEAVTLSAVARRLKVQAPSLYSHVKDREALLDGVAALALADLSQRIATAIAGRAGRDALDGFATAHREFAREAPGRWQSLQRRAGDTVVRSDAARRIVVLNKAVLRGYPIPEDQHVHAVRLLGATINGYLALERIGGFDHSHPSPDVSWRKTVQALDVLLTAWPADPGDPS
ncbi:transcriptional regulator [Actinoplanes cyaneus]|uniref:Transcriptional regulator n=1 Tax=Actinoplanes cyaneus TaxID=52696 RepID=A0A919MH11_9ACTN|nr:TetR/AcrR family transcriptional regulator [Actinoplanes cyaneus]MCW2144016.1 transcriptional regulator, TetR family [Actinoplanes cyaneus]GID70806.1 transcriptional regulator [Actinoplanes cyaneus]